MNGLVVHTMGFTGYARLNSNKDANNRSCSCGQGCESRPFMGEGRQVQVQGQGKKRLFRWHPCHIPRMALCSMPTSPTVTARWQTNQTNKKCQRSPALCKPPYNHLPSHTSSLKHFQREVGTAEDSASPRVRNLTLVWKSAPACFQAIDRASR